MRSLRSVSPHPSRRFAVAVAICAAALAGCGPFGGDDELTEEEFLAEGDAICEQGREQYLELQQDPPRSATEATELTRALVEITQGEIDELSALDGPIDSEDALEEYLAGREAGLEVLREGLAAAEEQDAQGYAESQAKIARGQVDRARLADAVGFSECSRPLTDSAGPVEDSPPDEQP